MDWFNAEDHVDKALDLYERGRWAEAEAELRKAIAVNPDQGEWHFNLGLTLEADDRDEEALASYMRAVNLLPDEPSPLIAAGMISNRLGRFDAALELLERATRIDPACEIAYAHRMDSLIRLGRHEDAETVFYLAQQQINDAPNCLLMMAESLIHQGSWEKAGWCLREALRLEPTLRRARARLGAVLAATGQPDRAVQMLLRELRDDPGNIDTLLDLGELLADLNRLPEAAEKFRRVLELEPANIDAHLRLGKLALTSHRLEEAHVEFELVLKLQPETPGVRTLLVDVLLTRGLQEEARRHLHDEMGRLPVEASPTELAALGELFLRADLPANAVQMFDLAATVEPPTPALLRRLSYAAFKAGDRRQGVRVARRVLGMDRRCAASIHNLAMAAILDGRFRRAAVLLRHGLAAHPEDEGLRRLRFRLWLGRGLRLIGL